MDRGQAAEHERLTILPHVRLAVRTRGPVPEDEIWAAAEVTRRHDRHDAEETLGPQPR